MVEEEQSPAAAEAGGYLSQEGKRRFTLIAGVLGGGCFIAQMVLPFVAMLVIMGGMMAFSDGWMRHADPELSAYHAGRIWYVERGESARNEERAELKTITPGVAADPGTVTTLDGDLPMLLSTGKRLWLVTPARMGQVNGSVVSYERLKERLGDHSLPFVWKGEPAVVEHKPSGTTLLVFRDGGWQKQRELEFSDRFGRDFRHDLQAVSMPNGDIHFFVHAGDSVYHRARLLDGELEFLDEAVASSFHGSWHAARVGRRLLVLSHGSSGQGQRVIAHEYDGTHWREAFEVPQGMAHRFGLVPLDGDRAAVLSASLSRGIKVTEVEAGKVLRTTQYGSSSPFPPGMMAAIFVPHVFTMALPLLLAFILSGLMPKYRIVDFEWEGRRVRQASLTKRAVAQLIDAAIVFAPMGLAFFNMWEKLFDFDRLMGAGVTPLWLSLSFVLAAMVWPMLCFFAFGLLEGRWGWTPGKGAVGIRVVGTDLEPCGFGRALLRNLLKAVDGFFNFMVGVMLVALTENWQRVGDLAARTLVIESRHPRSRS